jgi:hypothetical protein
MVKGKGKGRSALALFEAWIFLVDDVDTALPADDLAVRGTAFDGSANSHDLFFKLLKRWFTLRTRRQKCLHAIKRKSGTLSKGGRMASAFSKFFKDNEAAIGLPGSTR